MSDLPVGLTVAVLSIVLGQGWKVLRPVFRAEKPEWSRFLQSGGMPSSHTAATSSLAIIVGLREGFNSTMFTITAVLCFLVAHDAIKVRGTINIILNILRRTVPEGTIEEFPHLPGTVGHNFKEVIFGFALSVVVALGVHFSFLK